MNPSPVFNICFFSENEKTQSISFNYFNNLFESQKNVIINPIPKNIKFKISSFSLNNISIVLHSLKQIMPIKEDNLNPNELEQTLDNFLKETYECTIDFLFVIYSVEIVKQINILAKKWDNFLFLIFPMNSQDYFNHPHKNKFQIRDDKIVSSLIDLINRNFLWKDEYELFNQYSQEKYYSTFALYSKRRKELMEINNKDRLILFNQFELLSFDYEYCADDCIIFIQLFSQDKDKIAFEMKRNNCSKCNSQQSICSFDKLTNSYLCDNCLKEPNENSTKFKCFKCIELFQKSQSDKFVVTLCCKICYCVKCLKEQVNLNTHKAIEQKNLSLITCYCGNVIDSFVIRYILGDSQFQSLFKLKK